MNHLVGYAGVVKGRALCSKVVSVKVKGLKVAPTVISRVEYDCIQVAPR